MTQQLIQAGTFTCVYSGQLKYARKRRLREIEHTSLTVQYIDCFYQRAAE